MHCRSGSMYSKPPACSQKFSNLYTALPFDYNAKGQKYDISD